jgi:integrase
MVLRGGTLRVQVTLTEEGERVRRWVDLGTENRVVARRKLARMLAADATAEPGSAERAKLTETVAEFTATYVERRKAEGVKTWKDEERWLKTDVLPIIGTMPIDEVRPVHIREALDDARERGRGRQSLIHIRGVMHRLFAGPWRDEIIAENPVARVELPRIREVHRARAILTDAEFVQFVTCEAVDLELRVMAVASRVVGGMRTGDVHAWSWDEIDRVDFARCIVPRLKTGEPQELLIPDTGRVVLQAWWGHEGKPTEGPVFPVRRGPRAGEHKGKASHAQRLRRALLVAGVTRHEIHNDSATTRRADFHSFRRAFSTALADAGANVQLASRLAGHADLSAHNRYLMQSEAMKQIPEAAVPQLPEFARGVCKLEGEKSKNRSGWWDLNPQQPAPKAGRTVDSGRPTCRFTGDSECACRHGWGLGASCRTLTEHDVRTSLFKLDEPSRQSRSAAGCYERALHWVLVARATELAARLTN